MEPLLMRIMRWKQVAKTSSIACVYASTYPLYYNVYARSTHEIQTIKTTHVRHGDDGNALQQQPITITQSRGEFVHYTDNNRNYNRRRLSTEQVFRPQ